jgi:hypothetical protein
LNRRTLQSFVVDHHRRPSYTLPRTGDLARFETLPDGAIGISAAASIHQIEAPRLDRARRGSEAAIAAHHRGVRGVVVMDFEAAGDGASRRIHFAVERCQRARVKAGSAPRAERLPTHMVLRPRHRGQSTRSAHASGGSILRGLPAENRAAASASTSRAPARRFGDAIARASHEVLKLSRQARRRAAASSALARPLTLATRTLRQDPRSFRLPLGKQSSERRARR